MLWSIRARMKPALTVIEMIPNVHRTPALATLRRAVMEGQGGGLRLSREDRELAFFDGQVQQVSPIGARMLLALYRDGRIKLKKPAVPKLNQLEMYIATEDAFRAQVAELIAEDEAARARLAVIVADPSLARVEEISVALIDKVATAQLGFGACGSVVIAGVTCQRSLGANGAHLCWWLDAEGLRQGDPEA